MRRLGYALALIVCAGTAVPAQAPPQQTPVNLKVLPKEMPRREVVQVMRAFTRGLGVRCEHCHVGEGSDLSKFDFASDAKPTKEIARKMLTMVMEINSKHLAGVGEPPASAVAGAPAAAGAQPARPAQKVTCYTCHRGTLKPLTAPPAGEGRGGLFR